MHCLVNLERSSADKLQDNCISHDADSECVATKKSKLLGATCSQANECHVPTVCREVDYCNRLLDEPRTRSMHWQSSLIQRHLAWTRRLCQSKSSPILSFHNSLSV